MEDTCKVVWAVRHLRKSQKQIPSKANSDPPLCRIFSVNEVCSGTSSFIITLTATVFLNPINTT